MAKLAGKTAHLLLDARRQFPDRRGELVAMRCRCSRHRNAWCSPKLPVNAGTSCGIFGRIRALALSVSTCASRSPSINAASIARPQTPRMSVVTDDSLIPASSSSFCNRCASRVIRSAKQTDSRAATFEGESVEVDAM